jgi:hypothetical protein
MTAEQEAAFWQTIDAFDEMKLLRHVMIVGSWAEYIFNRVFKSGFIANLKTRDVDFFYANVNRPAEKIPLAETLKKIGFLYDEVDGISKFYKGDLLELEFISRVLGSGNDTRVKIKPLGITSEALRDVNIFAKFPLEVKIASPGKKNYTITVPEPSAYAVQKILANPSRVPAEKKLKDMISVK